jgi:hypothetical protein
MSGGTISGNVASSGDGVSVPTFYSFYATFIKQSGGAIYGSNASDGLKYIATRGYGHATYAFVEIKIRDITAGEDVTLDSRENGFTNDWDTLKF